ncbi:MAG: hypothetical protein QW591_02610 [Candidatus Micrarchaeaceae archaeon]
MSGIAIGYLAQFAPVALGIIFLIAVTSINYGRGRLRIICSSQAEPCGAQPNGTLRNLKQRFGSMPMHITEFIEKNPTLQAYYADGLGYGIRMWRGYMGAGDLKRGAFIRNAYERLLSDGLLKAGQRESEIRESAFIRYGLIALPELGKIAKLLRIHKAERLEIFDSGEMRQLADAIESYTKPSGLLLAYTIDNKIAIWHGVFN